MDGSRLEAALTGANRIYKTKQDTSAPTVAIESLFLSCVIDAKERRNVMTCNIPGAFMQANMDEVLYMRLEGPLANYY